MRTIILHIRLFLVIVVLNYSIGNAQLVLPGDHPDPSVAMVGNKYWASATTSNWAPAYPLLSSSDLIHWETKGYVFPELPEWADYYFWAPEISYDNGRIYIYYTAHKKGGNLCLGIASADKPEGPYKDHGPVMCQDVGSIDAFPMRDENGRLFLIWKEDGNSVGKPTPIWMSELNEDRSGLTGEKIELFRNDVPWESNLVEGVSMIRHDGYFFAFYAASGCCGKDCSYATGIARSKNLAGPWEKYSRNPLMVSDDKWICPGHGTPVQKDGKYYFLYHAYNKEAGVFAGRQGLLREFEFTNDGWVRFLDYSFPPAKPLTIKDEFDAEALHANWQWSVFQIPNVRQAGGELQLSAGNETQWTYIAQKSYTSNYRVRVKIDLSASTAHAGIAAIGDEKNIVAATVSNGKIAIWKTQLGKDALILEEPIAAGDDIYLEMKVENGYRITFRCSRNGKSFKTINKDPIDGGFLPPWDRPVRIGLITKGRNEQKAVFENFILYH
jgi:xylan 1,4-beta-xylosidase